MSGKEGVPIPQSERRKNAAQKGIEKRFVQSAADLLDGLHNDLKMTIPEINEFLGIKGAYLLMRKLGVSIRTLAEGKQESWKKPDRSEIMRDVGIRSPEVIKRVHEAAREAKANVSDEERKKLSIIGKNRFVNATLEERQRLTVSARTKWKQHHRPAPVRVNDSLRSKLGRGRVVAVKMAETTYWITVEFPGGLKTEVPENLIDKTYFLDNTEGQKQTGELDDAIARLKYARNTISYRR